MRHLLKLAALLVLLSFYPQSFAQSKCDLTTLLTGHPEIATVVDELAGLRLSIDDSSKPEIRSSLEKEFQESITELYLLLQRNQIHEIFQSELAAYIASRGIALQLSSCLLDSNKNKKRKLVRTSEDRRLWKSLIINTEKAHDGAPIASGAIDTQSRRLFLGDSKGTLSLVDLSEDPSKWEAKRIDIASIQGQEMIASLAVDPNNQRLFIGSQTHTSWIDLNADPSKWEAQQIGSSDETIGNGPIVLDPGTNRLYIAGGNLKGQLGQLSVVDLSEDPSVWRTKKLIHSDLEENNSIEALAIDSNNQRLFFITSKNLYWIQILSDGSNLSAKKIDTTESFPGAQIAGMAFDQVNSRIFLTGTGSNVAWVDLAGNPEKWKAKPIKTSQENVPFFIPAVTLNSKSDRLYLAGVDTKLSSIALADDSNFWTPIPIDIPPAPVGISTTNVAIMDPLEDWLFLAGFQSVARVWNLKALEKDMLTTGDETQ